MSKNETLQGLPETQITPPQREILGRGDIRKVHPERGIGLDVETGLPIVATVELPDDKGQLGEQDPSRVMKVVYSPKVGYLLCPPGTRPAVAEQSMEDARDLNELPIKLGDKPGNHVVIGRSGVMFQMMDARPLEVGLDAPIVRSLAPMINVHTHNQHVVFDVAPDGLQISDFSTNGTAVETPTV